jgi:zinc transport system substrate-binding protein
MILRLFLLFLILSNQAIAQQKIPVFVTILPQKYFVEQIGGKNVKVSVLVPPGKSAETYEPTPRQMTEFSQAKLYFSIGMPFEEIWLPKLKANNPQMRFVDAKENLTLRTLETLHHHEDHDHGLYDPHIWLNPAFVEIMAKQIQKHLSDLNPENSQQYQINTERFIQQLKQLDQNIHVLFKELKKRKFMVFHPAWGYFADAYKLQQIPIEMEGKEPSSKTLGLLIEKAKQEKISAIFVQQQINRRPAESIAKAINAQVISVDPLAENYVENLFQVAQTFAKAMQ